MPTGTAFITGHPAAFAVTALTALLTLWLATHLLRHATRTVAATVHSIDRADLLTYVAASIATGVATQGMWNFFGDVLDFPQSLRVGMFTFFELAVITSAVRARRNMREHSTAGVDGIAVWVLTSASAIFSAMDADSIPEAAFRLTAPLVAAWLWERGMALERRRATGRTIHWRITPERILVRLGLAEPTGRTAGQVDTERRLTRLAVAARTVRALPAGSRRHIRAMRRLDRALRHAVTSTALSSDHDLQRFLLGQLAALSGAESLASAIQLAPWTVPPVGVFSDLRPRAVETVPGPGVPEVTSGPPFSEAFSSSGLDLSPGAPGPDPVPAPLEDPFPEAIPEAADRAPVARSADPILPAAPQDQDRAESTFSGDEQIIQALAKAERIPSIRALKKQYSIGYDRARTLIEAATITRKQNPISPKTKIHLANLQDPTNLELFEHTPMQLVDVGQPSTSPTTTTGQ